MTDYTSVGYLITVDGTTLINHSTLRAINTVSSGATAIIRTYTLPSGVKIDYDGTADTGATPGRMAQEILCTTGGATLFLGMESKLGHYVTSIFSPLSGVDLENTATRVAAVENITPRRVHGSAIMHIRVTIEVVGDWGVYVP